LNQNKPFVPTVFSDVVVGEAFGSQRHLSTSVFPASCRALVAEPLFELGTCGTSPRCYITQVLHHPGVTSPRCYITPV